MWLGLLAEILKGNGLMAQNGGFPKQEQSLAFTWGYERIILETDLCSEQ